MTKAYWGRLWGLAFVMGNLLLGYALAAPARLTVYFIPKPAPDLIVDSLLIGAATVLAFRWVKTRGFWSLLLIPVLALLWLRVDFILFSKSEWWSVISYAFIAWWAVSIVVFWRCFASKGERLKKLMVLLMSLVVGFLWGFFDNSYLLSIIASCLFFVVLPVAGFKVRIGEGLVTSRVFLFLFFLPIFLMGAVDSPVFFSSQKRFHDKVVFSHQTRFQRLDVTEWKGNYWFYQEGINQFSSIDSWLYFEPFAHPAMHLVPAEANVLIVGGENGMLAQAIASFEPRQIDLLPVDYQYYLIAKEEGLYVSQNGGVTSHDRVNVINEDPLPYISKIKEQYDVIFVDVPDPVDIELNQYFTREFYELAHEALKSEGLMVTQSGSPYFATAAFRSIQETMASSGFSVVSYHNQILTLGEWGWTMGSKHHADLRSTLKSQTFERPSTQWLNQEAMDMMLSFGKPYVSVDQIVVNTIRNPVIHRYYNRGNYQFN